MRTAIAVAAIFTTTAAPGCAADEQAAKTTVVETTTVAATVATTVTTSQTVTETVPAEEAPKSPNPGPKRKSEIRFRGNGDTRLPPFRVRRGGAVLRWMNNGEVFSLFDRRGTIVDSVGVRGLAFLGAGVYRIDVVASGSWVITVPRAHRMR